MKIRIPVDSTLLQRDAIVNKDSLLTNTFIDKEANQFEYLTKRPGFLLGIGGVTNGINYGIYINPNTGDFYYIGGNGTPILGTPPNYWNKDTNYSIGIIVIYKGRLYTALIQRASAGAALAPRRGRGVARAVPALPERVGDLPHERGAF